MMVKNRLLSFGRFGMLKTQTSRRAPFPGKNKIGVRDWSVREASNPSLSWCLQSLAPFLLPEMAEGTGQMQTTAQNKRSVGSIRINVTPEEIINQDNAVRTVERQAALLQMVHCRVLSLCNEAGDAPTESTSLSYKELCGLEIAIGSIVESLEGAIQ